MYEIHNSLRVPATSYNPDIFDMLFLAKDNLVRYLRGGMLTIFEIEFDEIDNFYTLTNVLKTDVYNLSIGGFFKLKRAYQKEKFDLLSL